MSERACVPVINCWREYVQRVPMRQAQEWCTDGRAIEVPWEGTCAVMVTAAYAEYLRSTRPPVGQHYSHQHETPYNPRGVWTFTRQYA